MTTNGDHQDLSKDEVGWYFVEQYYNTLSKSPEKLHLYYGTKSQFVYGLETEVSNVSVGRQDIHKRIAKLDFQDSKVRVSNVDAQASLDNIVIQVIGEISNKAEEPRKFVQTFVLAKQQAGYFVLNDILRYIKEEVDEATEETPAEASLEGTPADETALVTEPAETVESEAAPTQLDVADVDEKLEEVSATTPEPAAVSAVAMPTTAAPATTSEQATTPTAPSVLAVQTPDAEKASEEVAEEEVKTEAPKESTPTPTATRAAAPTTTAAAQAPAPTEPEKPKGPPKAMTWASRAAAAAGTARPPVALPKHAPVAVPRPAATAAATAAATPASPKAPIAVTKLAAADGSTAPVSAAFAAPAKDVDSEWHTAGADSKRQNRPQSVSSHSQDKDTTLAYVKYVTDKVDAESLRAQLEQFGQVVYFDVSRPKNCAFVEFGTSAGYQSAVAANPHTINGENVLVEARRPKAGAYGGSNYNRGNLPERGNLSGRGGRGGYETRNGNQGGGRGGFSNGPSRGRGGGASRGRGGAQTATVA